MAGLSLNTVLSTLKACVISNPDGVDEDRLNSEFRQLMGCNIPWKELGFKNVHDLIASSQSLKVVTRGGRRLVTVEASGANHLLDMIKKQKKPSSSRKRTPRFHHKAFISNKSPSFFGRGYSYSGYPPSGYPPSGYPPGGKRSSTKKVDFVERNNNFPSKPPPGNKEVHHNLNFRPAGDSSSSGHSSPTFTSNTDLKPILKQTQDKTDQQPQKNEVSKNQQKAQSKTKPKVPLLPLPVKVSHDTKNESKTKKSDSSKTKSPVKSSNKTQSPTSKSPGPYSPLIPPTTNKQNSFNMVVPDLIPREPVVYFSPTNLQSAFIPSNLVPPKPMKPGYYRGGRRKCSMRSKLMSIKDNSKPTKGSLTAQFINLIKAQEWPEPEYMILPRVAPNKVEVYSCTVRGSYTIDNNETLLAYDYSTIPDEYPNMIACKEAVSKKAYEDMSNKINEASNYVPATSNSDDVIKRVHDIVSAFPNGLWMYKVESDYKNKYGERMPSGWIGLIKETDCLVAEKLADFSHVIRTVDKTESEEISASEMCLGELEYPATETWDVFVTKVVSASEVWFRFVGPSYSDWLDEVTKEMCNYYDDWTLYICPSPEVGNFYVYPSIYGAVRVKILSLDNPTTAKVMHVDHGDIEEVPRDHLCILDSKFYKLPPQAVCCKMYDLEDYSFNKLCNAFLFDKIEGMVLVAEIIQTEPLVLIMFDTSCDDPVNLNQDIVNQLKTNITTLPSLPQEQIVHEGVITSIWRTGEIYLQLPNDGLTYLLLQLNSMQDVSSEHYITLPDEILPDMLYLVQVDGQWLRATVLLPARAINNMVELLLVDTGDIKTSLYTQLVMLSSISMVLCEIPRQAVRVRLSNVNIYEETVDKLQTLMSPPCKALIKVISLGQVPEVEIYIRNSQGLISINQTISLEENLSNKVKSIALTSSTDFCTIKQAMIPECEDFFEVFVISVSNPSNFIVIPRKYLNELTNLQSRLQDYYNSVDHSTFRLRNFSIGQACAVKHTDSHWYRGLIEQVIDRSMSQLMIRFCDFGNFAMISADRLLALDHNFLSLPALGFSASIADIQPISGDWEFADCIRVQKLMLEKNLVTLIKSKTVNQEMISLKLQVFDTTGVNDCDIGNILVEELRATYIC